MEKRFEAYRNGDKLPTKWVFNIRKLGWEGIFGILILVLGVLLNIGAIFTFVTALLILALFMEKKPKQTLYKVSMNHYSYSPPKGTVGIIDLSDKDFEKFVHSHVSVCFYVVDQTMTLTGEEHLLECWEIMKVKK